MRLRRGSSAAVTMLFFRKLRLRFCDFLVKIWFAKAFSRLSRPVPVTFKRFLAPLFVFIFGIAYHLMLRCCVIVQFREKS